MAEKVHANHGRDHLPTGADPIPNWPGGNVVYPIKVFTDTQTVVVGDGAFGFVVTSLEEIAGKNLVAVSAYVTTVSSSGAITVQVRNVTGAADMLSTPITIDASEFTSDTAAAPVIDTSNDDVALGDLIAIDIDADGTGATGLGVILAFA